MRLTHDIFTPHIGKSLTVTLDDGAAFPLTLRAVTPTEAQKEAEAATAFTLDLIGPLDPVIAPLTYPVDVPGAAPVHLFVSAHGQDDSHTLYCVVVN